MPCNNNLDFYHLFWVVSTTKVEHSPNPSLGCGLHSLQGFIMIYPPSCSKDYRPYWWFSHHANQCYADLNLCLQCSLKIIIIHNISSIINQWVWDNYKITALTITGLLATMVGKMIGPSWSDIHILEPWGHYFRSSCCMYTPDLILHLRVHHPLS